MEKEQIVNELKKYLKEPDPTEEEIKYAEDKLNKNFGMFYIGNYLLMKRTYNKYKKRLYKQRSICFSVYTLGDNNKLFLFILELFVLSLCK